MSDSGSPFAVGQFFNPERSADGWNETSPRSRDWEHAYRDRWQHDRVVRSTHGVTKLVSFSGQPATVPDPFIEALTRSSDPDTGLLCPEKDLFEAGATVTIMDGPLQGLEAIFKVHDGEQRSFILLELLGKAQLIKIDSSHLAPSGRD